MELIEELLDGGTMAGAAANRPQSGDGMSPLCLVVRKGHDDRVSADSDARAWGNSRLAKKKDCAGKNRQTTA